MSILEAQGLHKSDQSGKTTTDETYWGDHRTMLQAIQTYIAQRGTVSLQDLALQFQIQLSPRWFVHVSTYSHSEFSS